MSQNPHQFEDLIKQALEGFEVEFNPAHWEEMESRLDLLGQGTSVSMNTFYGAFVAASIFMAGLVFFGMPEDKLGKHAQEQQEQTIEEDTVATGIGTGNATDGSMLNNDQTNSRDTKQINTLVMDVPESKVEKLEVSSSANRSKTSDGDESAKLNEDRKIVDYDEMTIKKIRSSVSQGCEGAPVTFSTAGNESEGNFLWNFGDGYFSNNQNPVHIFDAPGVFDVSLLVTPLTGGKLTPMTIEDQIKINPRPKASFKYAHTKSALGVPQVKFENQSKNVDHTVWMVNNEVVSDEKNPVQNFTEKGTYNIQLVAINEHGCADTTFRKITIEEDYNLHAPSLFTPNNDGRNDYFMPQALKSIDGTFELQVFDPRTDMIIFESDSFHKPWDGTIAGTNVNASSGNYNWIVNITHSNGTSDSFKGQVKLKK